MKLFKLLAAAGVVAVTVFAANRLSANVSSAASCLTTGSGAIANSNTICYTEPATYVTTVYEIGLCRSEPSAPTASVAMDLTTNCVATFQSATGVEVSVRRGTPTSLSGGTITAPPAGTYTYGYAVLSPTFKISGSFDFESSRRPEQLPSATAGTKCWTTAGETYLYTPTLIMPVECGTTPPSPLGEVTSNINSFSDTQPDYDFQRVDTDGTHKAYLLTSDLKLGSSVTASSFGTGATAVSRMVGLAPMQVTVTSSTQTMDLAIAVSKGATFVPGTTQSGQRTIFGIFSGPPTLAMSVQ